MSDPDPVTTLKPPKNWPGHFALRALNVEQKTIERRARRHGIYPTDAASMINIERTRRELLALGRAKVWGDQQGKMHPLNLVRQQANELHKAGLDLRCLNPQDLLAIRGHWPEWDVEQDIDLSVPPVSQRMPERDGPGDAPEDVESNDPAAGTGPETPDPPV